MPQGAVESRHAFPSLLTFITSYHPPQFPIHSPLLAVSGSWRLTSCCSLIVVSMSVWPRLSIPCPHGGIVQFCSLPNSSQGYCIPPAGNESISEYQEDDPTPESTTPSNHGNTHSENCAQSGSWWTCPNKYPLLVALKDCCAGTLCTDSCLQANTTQIYHAFNLSDADFLLTLGFSTPSTTSCPNNGFTLPYTPAGVEQIASAAQKSVTSTSPPGNTPTGTAAGQSTLGPTTPAPKSNTAAIAGGVAGGIVGLALLLALLAICCRRRINRPQRHMDEGKYPRWGPGNARSSQPGDAEQEEIKQGPSLST